ncbi:MAG: DNA-binding protein [Anaerolineae bacterium]|nr:DNA-binding protein [Anaerolineae bacterium]
MENAEIAGMLAEAAVLLDEAGASPLQVEAYRAAAATVGGLDRPAERVLAEEGEEGLKRLPHVTDRMAAAIEELVRTGALSLLDQLRADVEPDHVFDAIRGIGPALARGIQERLGIVSIEELERASRESRLRRIPGIGSTRARRIEQALRERLIRHPAPPPADPPPVDELLSVDQEYREKVAAGQVHRIAPERYNPKREAWLPVLHTGRGARRYSAQPANTHLAHSLHTNHDWVILYYSEGERQGQAMVVTEIEGDLAGRRVVRGREEETRAYYQREAVPAGGAL